MVKWSQSPLILQLWSSQVKQFCPESDPALYELIVKGLRLYTVKWTRQNRPGPRSLLVVHVGGYTCDHRALLP